MRVGYVRCSTAEQNEARQLKMMEEQNPPTCNGPETGDNLSSMSPSENEDAQ